ncbi:MAG: aminotransferase class V-fold PLP-dependent enzyme [Aureispira sp.]
MNLHIDYIRAAFPALDSDTVFFDNAGGSQILGTVVERIVDYYQQSNVQLGGAYALSDIARARVNAGTASMGHWLHAAQPQEAIVGPSASALIRLFAEAIGSTLEAGDEVIITDADHEANRSPWLRLQAKGIIIKTWQFDANSYRLEWKDLEGLLTAKTKLVAFCQVSNVFGNIHPIQEIAAQLRQRQILSFVDGVAYAPHRLPDVQASGVDFYVASIYKVYGPHVGVLYGREEHLLRLPNPNHTFITADDLPYKFQLGGPNYELTYSLTGIVDYLQQVAQKHGLVPETPLREQWQYAYDLFSAHEAQLTQRLLDFLQQQASIQIIGDLSSDPKKRVSTISFVVKGKNSAAIAAPIAAQHLGIKTGDFYTKTIIQRLGLEAQGGVIRVSMVHYNTLEEVDQFIQLLKEVL